MSSEPHLLDWLGDGRYRLSWTDGSHAIYEPDHEGSRQFILQAEHWYGFSNALAWLYESHPAEIERCLDGAREAGSAGFAP